MLVHRCEAGAVPPKITVIKPNNDKSDRVSGSYSDFYKQVHIIRPAFCFALFGGAGSRCLNQGNKKDTQQRDVIKYLCLSYSIS